MGALSLRVFLVGLGAGSGTFSLDYSSGSLNLVGQPLGRNGYFLGVKQTPRICRESKISLALGGFKFSVCVLCLADRAPA
jgi:hypothetical protein